MARGRIYNDGVIQAVILAGGRGDRLRPLTDNVPKPMVPVHGRPYLAYQLDELKRQGIADVVLLTGYLGETIENYFGDGAAAGLTHVEAGVLALTRRLVRRIPAGRVVSLEQEFFPQLIAGRQLAAFATARRFYDIGTPSRLKEIEAVLR